MVRSVMAADVVSRVIDMEVLTTLPPTPPHTQTEKHIHLLSSWMDWFVLKHTLPTDQKKVALHPHFRAPCLHIYTSYHRKHSDPTCVAP